MHTYKNSCDMNSNKESLCLVSVFVVGFILSGHAHGSSLTS